ncbi:MAG: fimbrillin family protein [Rikenellaceae bacterium]
MKKLIYIAVAMAITACAANDSLEGAAEGPQELTFTSGIESRVSDDMWVAGDKIGVHTLDFTVVMETGEMEYVDNNVCLVADYGGSSTTFSLTEGFSPIFLPDSSPIYFVLAAYYPYISGNDDPETCVFDISDQTDLSAVDYMTALAYITTSGVTSVNFAFEHVHCRVKFTIKASDSVPSLEGMEFNLSNIQTIGIPGEDTSDYSALARYGYIDEVTIDFADDYSSATVELILFPTDGNITNAYLYLTIDGQYYVAPFATTLSSGRQQNYTVTLGEDQTTISGATITAWGESDDNDDIIPTPDDSNTTFE